MLHLLAVVLLALALPLWAGVAIVLAVDLVVAGILGMLALSNKPDQIELEAASIRRQSLAEARRAATSLASIGQVAGMALGMTGRRRLNTGRAGKAWMIADLASRFIRRR